jgi:gamma-glutamyl:cysteine ligase YbdK (ATP-grasp superfamily)
MTNAYKTLLVKQGVKPHFQDMGVYGTVSANTPYRNGTSTGFNKFRVGNNGRFFDHGNKSAVSIKDQEYLE